MKIVIVEDEFYAQERLKARLLKVEPESEIIAVLDSVEESVKWFQENKQPDLLFCDIQLSDGISLEIFDKVEIDCPVIFTTAYDEYALQAFKVNSIDYLLKPISEKDLIKAFQKFKKLGGEKKDTSNIDIKNLLKQLGNSDKKYKSRFLVKTGAVMSTINIDEVAYFYIKNQLVYLVTLNNKEYIIDPTLDVIEDTIDPADFFRINRQMIVAFKAIKEIHPHFHNRLKLNLQPETEEEVIVSKRKSSTFKEWLED